MSYRVIRASAGELSRMHSILVRASDQSILAISKKPTGRAPVSIEVYFDGDIARTSGDEVYVNDTAYDILAAADVEPTVSRTTDDLPDPLGTELNVPYYI